MKPLIVTVLLTVLGTAPDAGTEFPDAGVYEVQGALATDGTALPDGWWLSRTRMVKVGEALEQCGTSDLPPPPTSVSIVFGLVLGALAGIGGTLYIESRLAKSPASTLQTKSQP